MVSDSRCQKVQVSFAYAPSFQSQILSLVRTVSDGDSKLSGFSGSEMITQRALHLICQSEE